VKGTLAMLRLLRGAGEESPYGISRLFGLGHVAFRSGAVVYITRCGAADVEIRIHT
jgi:hypothetical protein